MIILQRIWSWVATNWQWVLFPVGALLFFLGRTTTKKTVEVSSPELVGALKEKEEAEKAQEAKDRQAALERTDRVQVILENHVGKIASMTQEQAERVVELKDDPEALNAYLIEVGKDIRG